MSTYKKGRSRTVSRQPRTRARTGKVAISGGGVYKVSKNSITMGSQIPNFRNGKHSIIISNREYLQDVVTPGAAFDLSDPYPINPGMAVTFPWLHTIANCFEEYILHGVVFYFKSTCGNSVGSTTTSLGTVMMATNYNVSAPAFASKAQMENHEFGMSKKPSGDMIHPIECASKEDVLRAQYIRSTTVATGLDPRFYDHGNFYFATQGQQAESNLGELWISYDIELLKPKVGTFVAPGPPDPPEPCPTVEAFVNSGHRRANAAALESIAGADIFGQNGTMASWDVYGGEVVESPDPCICISPGPNGTFNVHPSNLSFTNGDTGLMVEIIWYLNAPTDTTVVTTPLSSWTGGGLINVEVKNVYTASMCQFMCVQLYIHSPTGAGPWPVTCSGLFGIFPPDAVAVDVPEVITSTYNRSDVFSNKRAKYLENLKPCPCPKPAGWKDPFVKRKAVLTAKGYVGIPVKAPANDEEKKEQAKKKPVQPMTEEESFVVLESNPPQILRSKVKQVSEPASPSAKPKVVSKKASGV